MDALAVFDRQRFVPNRFALVRAAAARAHALHLGRPPQVAATTDYAFITALQEVAAGAITVEEIDQFLSMQPPVDAAAPLEFFELGSDALAGVGTAAPDHRSRVECICATKTGKEDLHVEQHR